MGRDLKQSTGNRVRVARKRARLSQEALAARISRTPESISNIERGRQLPNVETLAELARALGVPLGDFFEGIGSERKVSAERARLEAEMTEIVRSLSAAGLRIAVEQTRLLKSVR